ncbi:hypothetical protein DL96DRAFT_1481327 [Flagelloscypha sp. PMI_526]|nr:hypothetical protein DL96DRAFT_1481327 [Flagelloscypha sp. PMI_526]
MFGRSFIDDEDFQQEIHEHLARQGDYCRAQDIVDYYSQPKVLERLGRTKIISLTTAQAWMKKMEYRWMRTPKGQYIDGHEREDVVYYRQERFLPAFNAMRERMRQFASDDGDSSNPPCQRPLVPWFHDESTFYAHYRRTLQWFSHKHNKIVPVPKGEGLSCMVADFFSPDYGYLRSPDGKQDARVLFKAGKNRDGYFDNDAILAQTSWAIEIVTKYFPDEDHLFIFDNATTHTKRSDSAITAMGMTVGPSSKVGRDENSTGIISIGLLCWAYLSKIMNSGFPTYENLSNRLVSSSIPDPNGVGSLND